MPKQPKLNGTPGKKPPAPSVKTRLARTPLAQRSGSKLLEPSVRSPIVPQGHQTGEIKSGAEWLLLRGSTAVGRRSHEGSLFQGDPKLATRQSCRGFPLWQPDHGLLIPPLSVLRLGYATPPRPSRRSCAGTVTAARCCAVADVRSIGAPTIMVLAVLLVWSPRSRRACAVRDPMGCRRVIGHVASACSSFGRGYVVGAVTA